MRLGRHPVATSWRPRVPVALLGRSVSAVAIHGQSDQLRLKSPAAHRRVLDAYGGKYWHGTDGTENVR